MGVQKWSKYIFFISLLFIFQAGCETFIPGNEEDSLQASGTVEATEITIAPELGGRVQEIFVTKGETVNFGQVLVQLDDSLLQAQLLQAKAALAIAQANYDLVAAGITAEQRKAAISAANLELLGAQQGLEDIKENTPLTSAQALQQVANVEIALDDAQKRLDSLNSPSKQSDIDAAHASLILAMDQLEDAQEDFEPYENKPEDNVTRATFQAKLAQAQQIYDAAERRYNNLVGDVNQLDLAQAEADLAMVSAQLDDAEREYEILRNSPDPDAIALAEARITNAQAQLALAQADTPTSEQLAVAQAQINSALANLEALQVQIDKTTITSPIDGVVLTRLIEPGEMTLPNSPLLTIARLTDLTITVYVPEDRYGQINLGDHAKVKVDSFPNKSFDAVVTRIADEAEFTPRNVQTQEERRTTVFAIELSVNNPSGELKPGMPADISF